MISRLILHLSGAMLGITLHVVADIGRGFDRNRDLDESGTFPNADGDSKIASTLSEAIHSGIAAAP